MSKPYLWEVDGRENKQGIAQQNLPEKHISLTPSVLDRENPLFNSYPKSSSIDLKKNL